MSEYIAKCKECVLIGGATMLFPEYIDMNHEIVRCRDCKFRCLNECTRIDEGFKDYWFAIEPNGYCAWGERKEGSE